MFLQDRVRVDESAFLNNCSFCPLDEALEILAWRYCLPKLALVVSQTLNGCYRNGDEIFFRTASNDESLATLQSKDRALWAPPHALSGREHTLRCQDHRERADAGQEIFLTGPSAEVRQSRVRAVE